MVEPGEEPGRRPFWRRPIFIVALLALVGIAGATTTYLLAEDLHAKDRAAIIAWRDDALPGLRDIRAQLGILVALEPRVFSPQRRSPALRAQLVNTRALIERARDRAHQVVTAVLEEAAAAYLTGVGETLDALSTLEASQYGVDAPTEQMRRSFEQAAAVAQSKFEAGEIFTIRLFCRARLPECV